MTIFEECLGESTDCAIVPILEKKSRLSGRLRSIAHANHIIIEQVNLVI
jgi:hypothetical protein